MFVSFSPIPWAKAGLPDIQKGTSAPKLSPISFNSSSDNLSSHRWFKPTNTAAALELPPAIPAATGIFFSMNISTPFFI